MVPGTDAGVSPGKPHDVLPYALQALVEQIGMTPLQALRAATIIAASAIGLGESKGRIAAGADADVVVVRGDPVADIGSITNVQAVFRPVSEPGNSPQESRASSAAARPLMP